MSYSKIVTMITELAKKTEDNKMNWEETNNENEYQVSFTNYTVRLSVRQSSEESTEYVIEILNEEGKTIEIVTDSDISDLMSGSYMIMKLMYEKVRRKVLGVEDALDSILNELRNDDIPF